MNISLRLAGVLLTMIAVAGCCAPRVLAYRENMSRVDAIVREVFYIHNVYMSLFVTAFALPCLFAPSEMSGTPLGRFFCGFLALAWLLRLILQLFYHNREIKRARPAMNILFTATFLYLGVAFTAAAALGG